MAKYYWNTQIQIYKIALSKNRTVKRIDSRLRGKDRLLWNDWPLPF